MSRPDNRTLKHLLTRRFPATSWSVKAGRGTSCSWTHISWTDGPTDQLVTRYLSSIGSAPGTMDITDYFDGERVSTHRELSDDMQLMVATALLDPKPVPPVAAWQHDVQRSNRGGWYNFYNCVRFAASNRENFERAQFDAHAWLEAWAHNRKDAPSAVNYESVGA